MLKITNKDIARVKKSLAEAKKQGDVKRISFLQATLNRYNHILQGWTN